MDPEVDKPEGTEVKSALTKQTRTIKKRRSTAPWNPANRLDVDNKKPGMVYRWVNYRDDFRFRDAKSRGWQVVRKDGAVSQKEAYADDPKSMGDAITAGADLVLMEMPEEKNKLIRDYFQEQADMQMESAVSLASEDNKLKGHFYNSGNSVSHKVGGR